MTLDCLLRTSLAVVFISHLFVVGAACSGSQSSDATTPDEVVAEPAEDQEVAEPVGETDTEPAETESPGASLVEERCAGCHDLETVYAESRTREAWAAEVDSMIGRGARLDDEERTVVIDYLANR